MVTYKDFDKSRQALPIWHGKGCAKKPNYKNLCLLSVVFAFSVGLLVGILIPFFCLRSVSHANSQIVNQNEIRTIFENNSYGFAKEKNEKLVGEEANRDASGENYAKTSGENYAKTSGENYAKFTGVNYAKIPDENYAKIRDENYAKTSGLNFARIPVENYAKNSGENYAKNSGENYAKTSGENHAKISDEKYSRTTDENYAKIPGENYAFAKTIDGTFSEKTVEENEDSTQEADKIKRSPSFASSSYQNSNKRRIGLTEESRQNEENILGQKVTQQNIRRKDRLEKIVSAQRVYSDDNRKPEDIRRSLHETFLRDLSANTKNNDQKNDYILRDLTREITDFNREEINAQSHLKAKNYKVPSSFSTQNNVNNQNNLNTQNNLNFQNNLNTQDDQNLLLEENKYELNEYPTVSFVERHPTKKFESIIEDNIYWGSQVEEALPKGFNKVQHENWSNYVKNSAAVKLEAGCGRMQNRLVTFEDGTQGCARYRQNTDQIQGELFSFYLAQILGLENLAPSTISVVNLNDKVWKNVANEIASSQWNSNRPVVLTKHISNLDSANIPQIFKPEDRHLNKEDVLDMVGGDDVYQSKDSGDFGVNSARTIGDSEVKSQSDVSLFAANSSLLRTLTELAQWSDLIVFDYLTANLDRIVNNLYNYQWNVNIMDAPAHNLAKKLDSNLLVFLDNESGLLHGYRLLKKYEVYHTILLDNLCVFRRRTSEAIKRLKRDKNIGSLLKEIFERENNSIVKDVLPTLPDKSIKILNERIEKVYAQITKCEALYSEKT